MRFESANFWDTNQLTNLRLNPAGKGQRGEERDSQLMDYDPYILHTCPILLLVKTCYNQINEG